MKISVKKRGLSDNYRTFAAERLRSCSRSAIESLRPAAGKGTPHEEVMREWEEEIERWEQEDLELAESRLPKHEHEMAKAV